MSYLYIYLYTYYDNLWYTIDVLLYYDFHNMHNIYIAVFKLYYSRILLSVYTYTISR